MAAVRAEKAVHVAVSCCRSEVGIHRSVDDLLALIAVALALPLGVALPAALVARHLHQVDAKPLHALDGQAGGVLGDLGAHVAAHGHVGLVAHGDAPRVGVLVGDDFDAVALQLAHSAVQRRLPVRIAGVDAGDGLDRGAEERLLGPLGHLDVVAAQHLGHALDGRVDLRRPLRRAAGPGHVVLVGRLKALLHDLQYGGVDVGAELLHHAAQLLGLRLCEQRGLGHGAGRLPPSLGHDPGEVVEHPRLDLAVDGGDALAGLLYLIGGQH